MQTTEVATGEDVKRELLDTNDVYLLDNNVEIFVWVGKGANAEERKQAMKVGTDYASQSSRPKNVKVLKVMEGGTPPACLLLQTRQPPAYFSMLLVSFLGRG